MKELNVVDSQGRWCEKFGCKINDEKQTFCCKFRKQLFSFFHFIYAYSIILRAYESLESFFTLFLYIFFSLKINKHAQRSQHNMQKFYLIFVTTEKVFFIYLSMWTLLFLHDCCYKKLFINTAKKIKFTFRTIYYSIGEV